MTRRILLADSDREWIKKAQHFLEKERYTVDTACNGKNAQLSLGKNRYFVVILGPRLKNHSSIRVMGHINTNHPGLKVILLLDNQPKDEEQGIRLLEKFKQYHIDHILPKSNNLQQLKEELDNLTPPPSPSTGSLPSMEEKVCCNDDQFSKVKKADFHTARTVFFDVFVRLKKSHYIKILHAGDEMEKARLDRYRHNQQVEWLYFKKKDLDKYIQFQNFLGGQLVRHMPDRQEIKTGIFKNVTDKYLEQSFYEGINSKVLKQGKKIAQNIGKMIEKEKNLMALFDTCCTQNSDFANHAFLVTLFATAMVQKLRWNSPKTLETIALASLFHDIGTLRLPKELIGKKTREMNSKELERYWKHPQMGAEMVGGSPAITHTIKQIILQHHEYYNGTGYPAGKRRNEILMLANVLSLVDDFVHTIIENDTLPSRALDIFLDEINVSPGRYHPAILNNFLGLFAEPEQFKKAS